jgi:hypothetical protein
LPLFVVLCNARAALLARVVIKCCPRDPHTCCDSSQIVLGL